MADNKVEMSSQSRSAAQNTSENYWNAANKYGLTRSPPESPRESFMVSESAGRRHSSITPEMIAKMAQRRASLDKLNVDKVAPWMYLYDFTDKEDKDSSE